MDVNGTRFHQLLGSADWARCSADAGIALSDGATLKPLLFLLPAQGAAADPMVERRGAARDRYGNWYWIDESRGQVLVQSSGSLAVSVFWPPARTPEQPRRAAFGPVAPEAEPAARVFGGVAVTDDHYLIVGTIDRPGLLAFDLHQNGPPRRIAWPPAVPFQPFDLAPAPGGGVFILDRENHRYWALDRHLGVRQLGAAPPVPDDFSAASGDADDLRPWPSSFPPGFDLLSASSPVSAVNPCAIEALPDGTVLVLDRETASVARYRLDQPLATAALDLSPLLATPPSGDLFGADLAFAAGTVYVPAADGLQAFAFDASFDGDSLTLTASEAAPFFPLRFFGGRGFVAAAGQAFYDVGDRAWVPIVEQKRPRFTVQGSLFSPILDGNEPGCVWHRLLFDGCVPPGATVEVWTRVSDDKSDVVSQPWSQEPDPQPRASGPELPLLPAIAGGDAQLFELLFQRAKGRYLQVRIRLSGDGRSSPRLRALRVWYPRFSYLERYLPAVYRDDIDSASFLDRFLANLEGLFTSVEDKMAVAQLLLDARTAPPEALDWLASFFGVALDPAWDEGRRRLFLRHAMQFFAMRGTVRGLTLALHLALSDCPDDSLFAAAPDLTESFRILEWFKLRETPALALGAGEVFSGIRTLTQGSGWTPDQGGAALLSRYQAAAAAAGLASPSSFPVVEPDTNGAFWESFSQSVLGFVPQAGAFEQRAFRNFLARRYRRPSAFAAAWGETIAGFDDTGLSLPTELPRDGAPLRDWYQFFAIAVACARLAHRFTVLLPVPAREAFAVDLHQQRRQLATRIVNLEKPAHTLFDVKFYWAMFRIGAARLGVDTLLDKGSRAPELMPPVVLDQAFLAESRLSTVPPERAVERSLEGQDPLQKRMTPEKKS
ncbi:MAG TPA: phage tail protein [Myxococcales bacterium]|jgi:phage tail-like protein